MNSTQFKKETEIRLKENTLYAFLDCPKEALGMVIFAHGSGSSRHSPRNQYVAKILQEVQIGTLLIDLLTQEEEDLDLKTREYRFNIPLLAKRLVLVTEWIQKQATLKGLPIGYFGSSTGAAAALIAASELEEKIAAVVSRGGRPDLAAQSLLKVVSPTLLIVGGEDYAVIDLNKGAYELLSCPKRMDVIPHATHLFEEHGALEEVAALAKFWFIHYFSNKSY